jgi:hypothetical protein
MHDDRIGLSDAIADVAKQNRNRSVAAGENT